MPETPWGSTGERGAGPSKPSLTAGGLDWAPTCPGVTEKAHVGWVLLGHVPQPGLRARPLLGRLVELGPRLAREAMPAEGLESPWGGGWGVVQTRGSLLPPLPHPGSRHPRLVEPKGVLSPPSLMLYPICPLVHPLKQSWPLHASRDGALTSSQNPSLFGAREHVPQLVLPLPRGPSALHRLFLLPGLA